MLARRTELQIDGLQVEELLELSREEVEAWICLDDPIVFKVGSADVLAQFTMTTDRLTVQLSVVEGGGDGVLLKLMNVIETLANHHRLVQITWQVHALNCAKPNPKLRRILLGYDFYIVEDEYGNGYFEKVTSINDSVLRRSRLSK